MADLCTVWKGMAQAACVKIVSAHKLGFKNLIMHLYGFGLVIVAPVSPITTS